MKKTFHFARKTRQIKYRRRLLKSFLLSGLFFLGSNNIKAQTFEFMSPIDIFEAYNFCPLDADINDTALFAPTGGGQILDVQFIDVDLDGDMDVFYSTFNHRCYLCAVYRPGANRILFQENETIEDIYFTAPIVVYSVETFNPYNGFSFAVHNFDNDNDFDFTITSTDLGDTLRTVFENESNNPYAFVLTNSIQNIQYNQTQLPISLSLLDVDFDGDFDLITGHSGNSIFQNEFNYLENNGSQALFPFDSIWQTFDFNQDAIQNSDSGAFAWPDNFKFVDFDRDGNTDLLLHSRKKISEGYTLYFEDNLYFHKNRSSNNFDFDINGELLLTRATYSNDQSSNSTAFYPIDLDNDGDIDINEIIGSNYIGMGYNTEDRAWTDSVLFHENITLLNTSTSNNEIVAPFQVIYDQNQQVLYFDNLKFKTVVLELYDASGRIVFTDKTTSNQFSFHQLHLSSGIFLYNVILDKNMASGKLVID